ncbi:MAG TPA: hypothetical protein VK148_31475 [Xanthobacteraceae bacterium]|nr:hypothetical protein [Xanthobacteraceae bacterium]
MTDQDLDQIRVVMQDMLAPIESPWTASTRDWTALMATWLLCAPTSTPSMARSTPGPTSTS